MLTFNFFDYSPLCGNGPATLPPFIETTTTGDVFEFNVTFTSTSADENDTSNGFSLSIVCELFKTVYFSQASKRLN